jgi:hypothetical protein
MALQPSEILRHPGQPHWEIDADSRGRKITIWGHAAGSRSIIEVREYHSSR